MKNFPDFLKTLVGDPEMPEELRSLLSPSLSGLSGRSSELSELSGLLSLLSGISELTGDLSSNHDESTKPVDMRFGAECNLCGELFYGDDCLGAKKFREEHTPEELDAFKLVFDQKVADRKKEIAKKQEVAKRQLEKGKALTPVVRVILNDPEIQRALHAFAQQDTKSDGVDYRRIERMISTSVSDAVAYHFREHDEKLKREAQRKLNNRWDKRLANWWSEIGNDNDLFWRGWKEIYDIDEKVAKRLVNAGYDTFDRSIAIQIAYDDYMEIHINGWRTRHTLMGWKSLETLFTKKYVKKINDKAEAAKKIEEEKAAQAKKVSDFIAEHEPLLIKMVKQYKLRSNETKTAESFSQDLNTLDAALREVSKKFWDSVMMKLATNAKIKEWEMDVYNNIPYNQEKEIVDRLKAEGKIPTDEPEEQTEQPTAAIPEQSAVDTSEQATVPESEPVKETTPA